MMTTFAFKKTSNRLLSATVALSFAFFPVGYAATLSDAPTAKDGQKWYRSEGKTDPFKPAVIVSDSVAEAATLVSFDTRDIKLVGTALGAELSALLIINNKGVIAKVGDKIGRSDGRIISISKEKIVVRQPVFSANGSTHGVKNIQKRYEDTVIRVADSTAKTTTKDKVSTNTEINTDGLGPAAKSSNPYPALQETPEESQSMQYDFSKTYPSPYTGNGTENR